MEFPPAPLQAAVDEDNKQQEGNQVEKRKVQKGIASFFTSGISAEQYIGDNQRAERKERDDPEKKRQRAVRKARKLQLKKELEDSKRPVGRPKLKRSLLLSPADAELRSNKKQKKSADGDTILSKKLRMYIAELIRSSLPSKANGWPTARARRSLALLPRYPPGWKPILTRPQVVDLIVGYAYPKVQRTDWFKTPLMVEAVVQSVLRTQSIRKGLEELQKRNRSAHDDREGLFDRMKASTIQGWFERVPKNTGKIQFCVSKDVFLSMRTSCGRAAEKQKAQGGVLRNHPELKAELKALVTSLYLSGCPLSSTTLRPVFIGIVRHRAPSLLDRWVVSRRWVRRFLQQEVGFCYRKATTAAQKRPKDAAEQWSRLVHRVAFAVDLYNIPPELVLNSDQTAVWLVPTNQARTFAPKGAREVAVLGVDDKRNVTCMPTLSASGDVLPAQTIWGGKTKKSQPTETAQARARKAGWDITQTVTHWSTLRTMKDLVTKILVPWVDKTRKKLNLSKDQRWLWLLDCWSVHRSKEFRLWLQENYPYLILIYIPGGMTGDAQPCDVALQRLFKSGVTVRFNGWCVEQTTKQLAEGTPATKIKLDLGLKSIRDVTQCWMLEAMEDAAKSKAELLAGWERCRLLEAWQPATQREARRVQQEDNSLFKTGARLVVADTPELEEVDSPLSASDGQLASRTVQKQGKEEVEPATDDEESGDSMDDEAEVNAETLAAIERLESLAAANEKAKQAGKRVRKQTTFMQSGFGNF
jgi:hypothetical protein